MMINNSLYSKSPHIRTYFLESQAEIGSYFKGTKTSFKVWKFLFEGCLVWGLTKDVQPYYLFSKGSPHIRTYFLESQAEIGSYFKGKKTSFKVWKFLFEGCLVWGLTKDVQPYYLFSKGSPHIRTYFLESQAEKGSYFKGTKTSFKVWKFLFEGCLVWGLTKDVQPYHLFSKGSPHIRTYFLESQAEVGSYFKGIKTSFKVWKFLFEGCLVWGLTKMFSPITCFQRVPRI